MKKISIVDRINRRRFFSFFALVLVALALVSTLVSKNPAPTQAFTFNANQLIVAANDVLYIGAGGLQSERVWGDTALYAEEIGTRADKDIDFNYMLEKHYTHPVNYAYGYGNLEDMKYPKTGGCPKIDSDSNTPNEYQNGTPITGRCMAIITDGGGAIITVSGNITINGTVFLGDRVVLIADGINLGPHARIIGSGQKGGSAIGHDAPAFGGIGAHNGGQAPPIKSCGSPNFSGEQALCHEYYSPKMDHYIPNDKDYYHPITATVDTVTNYFRTQDGSPVYGGMGSMGGNDNDHDTFSYRGWPTPENTNVNEIGIGGSGGSGSGHGTTVTENSGPGGGGGGGYGLALEAQTIDTDYNSLITVKGGDYGLPSERGGAGGPGGGGIVIMKGANLSRLYGEVDVDGGKGIGANEDWPKGYQGANPVGIRSIVDGSRGLFLQMQQSNSSIKKRLFPINRNGVSNTTFNPYALQLGDVIRVEINATQITPPARVTDNLLSLGGSATGPYCRPSDLLGGSPNTTSYNLTNRGSPTDGSVDIINGNVSWQVTNATPNTNGDYPFWYYCAVTRR